MVEATAVRQGTSGRASELGDAGIAGAGASSGNAAPFDLLALAGIVLQDAAASETVESTTKSEASSGVNDETDAAAEEVLAALMAAGLVVEKGVAAVPPPPPGPGGTETEELAEATEDALFGTAAPVGEPTLPSQAPLAVSASVGSSTDASVSADGVNAADPVRPAEGDAPVPAVETAAARNASVPVKPALPSRETAPADAVAPVEAETVRSEAFVPVEKIGEEASSDAREDARPVPVAEDAESPTPAVVQASSKVVDPASQDTREQAASAVPNGSVTAASRPADAAEGDADPTRAANAPVTAPLRTSPAASKHASLERPAKTEDDAAENADVPTVAKAGLVAGAENEAAAQAPTAAAVAGLADRGSSKPKKGAAEARETANATSPAETAETAAAPSVIPVEPHRPAQPLDMPQQGSGAEPRDRDETEFAAVNDRPPEDMTAEKDLPVVAAAETRVDPAQPNVVSTPTDAVEASSPPTPAQPITVDRGVEAATRTAATAAAPEANRTSEATMADLRSRAVERQVLAALRQGRDEVRVALYPPQLGQVVIRLALDGQKVRVSMQAANGEAEDVLQAGEARLRDALGQEGFQLSGFDVAGRNEDEGRRAPKRPYAPPAVAHKADAVGAFSIDMIA